MATPLLIEIEGCDGQWWTVSGPNMGREGVELASDPEGLHDEAPFTTIWNQTASQEGATYNGTTWEPRDLVLSFDIYGEQEGETWEEVESRFSASFDVEDPALIRVTSPSGSTRTLKVTKMTSSVTSAKNDPRFQQRSKMVLTLRAAWPFWEGDTVVSEFVAPNGHASGHVLVSNPTDRPMWLKWALTAPGAWTLPDYNLKGPDHQRRTILTPTLRTGEDLTIDTYPTTETYTAANGSNIAGLFGGVDFLYPIPKRTYDLKLPVSVEGGGLNAACQVRQVHYWDRAYGWGV